MELLLPGPGLIIWSVIVLSSLILYVIALTDLVKSDFAGGNDKLIWVLLVLFLPVFGCLLYINIGRKNKIKLG